jgi:hypothetical protein
MYIKNCTYDISLCLFLKGYFCHLEITVFFFFKFLKLQFNFEVINANYFDIGCSLSSTVK